RALQIAEDNGDGLADLLGRWLRGEDGAAVAAEPEPVGVFLAAARARLHYLSLRPCPADGHYDADRLALRLTQLAATRSSTGVAATGQGCPKGYPDARNG